MSPWRRTLAAVAAVGALGGGAIALVTDGGSDRGRVAVLPEGGSGLRPPAGRPAPATGSTSATAQVAERDADAKLPVPLPRAAARVFLVGFPGIAPGGRFAARLRRREWGAVLVARQNVTGSAQLGRLTRGLAATARRAHHLPPLFAAPQLGGREQALPGAGPPSEAGTSGPDAARAGALRAGRSLRRRGVSVVLAPSADLGTAGGPWEGRSFSDQPEPAAQATAGAVQGWRAARVAPVVGHYPGEGAASQDPELGVATVGLGRDELRARDEVPFRAVTASTPAVQLSGALFAGFDGVTPATLDPDVVKALRAGGFRGAVVSANLTAATLATGGGVGEAAVEALKAGCDLLYVPGDQRDQEDAYQAVVAAVRSGAVPVGRLRDALARGQALRRAAS